MNAAVYYTKLLAPIIRQNMLVTQPGHLHFLYQQDDSTQMPYNALLKEIQFVEIQSADD